MKKGCGFGSRRRERLLENLGAQKRKGRLEPMKLKQQFTYALDGTHDMDDSWYAQFITDDGTGNDSGGQPGSQVLRKIFAKHYGAKTDDLFNFEMSENTHAGFAPTKKGAEKLLGEIAYVLDNAGLKREPRESTDHIKATAPKTEKTAKRAPKP